MNITAENIIKDKLVLDMDAVLIISSPVWSVEFVIDKRVVCSRGRYSPSSVSLVSRARDSLKRKLFWSTYPGHMETGTLTAMLYPSLASPGDEKIFIKCEDYSKHVW